MASGDITSKWSAFTAFVFSGTAFGSLANNTGVHADGIDNSVTQYEKILILHIIKTGTAPTANTTIDPYAVRFDLGASPTYGSEGATIASAAWTPSNADPLKPLILTASANTLFYKETIIEDPGPFWTAAWFNNGTGQSLNASGHVLQWAGLIRHLAP